MSHFGSAFLLFLIDFVVEKAPKQARKNRLVFECKTVPLFALILSESCTHLEGVFVDVSAGHPMSPAKASALTLKFVKV